MRNWTGLLVVVTISPAANFSAVALGMAVCLWWEMRLWLREMQREVLGDLGVLESADVARSILLGL